MNGVLQYVQTEFSDVDGSQAAFMNVGQQCVHTNKVLQCV